MSFSWNLPYIDSHYTPSQMISYLEQIKEQLTYALNDLYRLTDTEVTETKTTTSAGTRDTAYTQTFTSVSTTASTIFDLSAYDSGSAFLCTYSIEGYGAVCFIATKLSDTIMALQTISNSFSGTSITITASGVKVNVKSATDITASITLKAYQIA